LVSKCQDHPLSWTLLLLDLLSKNELPGHLISAMIQNSATLKMYMIGLLAHQLLKKT